MKNIRNNMHLYETISMSLDDFRALVEKITQGLQTVEYEFGAYITHTEKAEEHDCFINRDMTDILSEHFGVEVISWHSDTSEYPTVFILFKDAPSEERAGNI